MSESKPEKMVFLQYDEDDLQNIAEGMGYNRLSPRRVKQVAEVLAFSDAAMEEIHMAFEDAINCVMETLDMEAPNNNNG